MSQNNLLPLPLDVNKSNSLIRNKVKINNLLASRIFAHFVSLIKPTDTKFHEYEVPITEILQTERGGDNYRQIKDALYDIVKRCVLERKLEGNDYEISTVFQKVGVKKGNIFCRFNDEMKPYLLELQANYTKINLMEYLKLPSIYSQKLFELLKSWEKLGEAVLKLDELYRILDVPESYAYKDFRRQILEKAHKDIHTKTTLKYEYEPLKKGRSFTHIKFTFGQKMLEVKNEKTKEQSQDNNKLFIVAFNCAKNKLGICPKQDNKKKVCELCLQSKFCDGLLKQVSLIKK